MRLLPNVVTMSTSAQRLLTRIGRWPRRIAALACLLLAAGSALVPDTRATTAAPVQGVGAKLRSGEVAVPVPVALAGTGAIRPGDLVGVLAAPQDGGASSAVLVADHLRVLAVNTGRTELNADSSTVIVIAADRTRALRLTRFSTRPLVLIADDLP